jgi:hypothetical protein
VLGALVTLGATVTGTNPTGQVEFRDGATPVETKPLTSGSATATTQPLLQGTHSFTAKYLGDANHLESTSSAVSTMVAKADPSVSLSLLTPSQPYGHPVTFSVTVTGVPSVPVTGTATFKDSGVAISTVTLSNGTASLTTNYLSIGGHPITADYSGDGNYTAASATATQQITAQGIIIRSVPPQLLEELPH